jgi:hypothetical protein
MRGTNDTRGAHEEQPQQTPNTKTRTKENNRETTESNTDVKPKPAAFSPLYPIAGHLVYIAVIALAVNLLIVLVSTAMNV